MTGIYKITNTINNKCYIGQSVDVKRRWRQHKVSCEDYPLYRAFKKYGIENFNFEIILECSKEELTKQEQYYIQHYRSLEKQYGYNQVFPIAENNEGHGGHGKVLTYDQILEIFDILNNTDISKEDIAAQFGCTERTIRDINCGRSWKETSRKYPIREFWIGSDGKKYYASNEDGQKFNTICPICGGIKDSSSEMCKNCRSQQQRLVKVRPSRDELLEDIALNGFEPVGRKYGINGNSIRKWCKAYDLPTHTSDIKQLYQKEKGIQLEKKKKKKDYTVGQFDLKTGKLLNTFPSAAAAGKTMNAGSSHITEVCNGKLKQAYGYNWKYINQNEE